MQCQFEPNSNASKACVLLVTNLTNQGLYDEASAVIACNRREADHCSIPHCPICEAAKSKALRKKVMKDYQLTKAGHPRLGLFTFTGTIADVAVDTVAEAVNVLGSGMRRIMKAVRAYKASSWQIEIVPSDEKYDTRMSSGSLVHPHVHAAVMIPAKDQPRAEDMFSLWRHEMGAVSASTNWEKAINAPAVITYSNKREDLSGFSQADFDKLVSELRTDKGRSLNMRGRGYIN